MVVELSLFQVVDVVYLFGSSGHGLATPAAFWMTYA